MTVLSKISPEQFTNVREFIKQDGNPRNIFGKSKKLEPDFLLQLMKDTYKIFSRVDIDILKVAGNPSKVSKELLDVINDNDPNPGKKLILISSKRRFHRRHFIIAEFTKHYGGEKELVFYDSKNFSIDQYCQNIDFVENDKKINIQFSEYLSKIGVKFFDAHSIQQSKNWLSGHISFLNSLKYTDSTIYKRNSVNEMPRWHNIKMQNSGAKSFNGVPINHINLKRKKSNFIEELMKIFLIIWNKVVSNINVNRKYEGENTKNVTNSEENKRIVNFVNICSKMAENYKVVDELFNGMEKSIKDRHAKEECDLKDNHKKVVAAYRRDNAKIPAGLVILLDGQAKELESLKKVQEEELKNFTAEKGRALCSFRSKFESYLYNNISNLKDDHGKNISDIVYQFTKDEMSKITDRFDKEIDIDLKKYSPDNKINLGNMSKKSKIEK